MHALTNPGQSEDGPFEFLHMELVSILLSTADPFKQSSCPGSGDEVDSKGSVGDLPKLNLDSMEFIGFSTGYRIVERLTKDWPRFKDELDTMKFICKEFWTSVFKKQVDNLRTNKQGVYVLQDNCFRFLSKVSQSQQYLECSPKFVVYTSGLIRGALANLGIVCAVSAEVTNMPACRFQVQIHRT